MNSLRARTAIAFALLSAVIAIVMSVIVYRTSVSQRSSRLRTLALSQAHDAAVIYDSTQALVGDATLNDASAPLALRRSVNDGNSASQLVAERGSLIVWAGVPVPHAASVGIYVSNSANEDERDLRSLRTTLALTALGIIVLGAAVGTVLADRLSRRLRLAAGAAHAIADGDLSARVRAGGRDEVGVLSDAVDAMADALGSRIERERNFNADVAHELRTPVTGLMAAADLLEPGEVPEMIRSGAYRLHRLVEDLLEISRLEGGREHADLRMVPLGAFCADIAARYPGVRVSGDAQVRTDPRRLERIVVNLLENAVRHGAAPVTLTVAEQTLCVADAGPGFPADGAVMTRHVTHAERGHGLGLAIAAAQAEVIGARLELTNIADGGARATVRWAE